MKKSESSTLAHILHMRAEQQPDRVAFRFLADGEVETATLTYQDIDRIAQTIAAVLRQYCSRGDRALLLYQPGLDFITAFFGCLYAGIVAVPLSVPRFNGSSVRLESALTNAEGSVVLTTSSLVMKIRQAKNLACLRKLPLVSTDDLPLSSDLHAHVTTTPLAFLQYTSGSTSSPRGVMVTHENLLANVEMIRANFGWHDKTVMVSWLPLFHDMGLIGNTLTPVYVGFECIQMPPAAFLQHPGKWLVAASRYRATCIGAPDFAYALCSRRTRPDQLDQLDLSTLEWAYSGAEPVRLETIEAFTSVFSHYGFRKKAWYPCYGLAEATLFVSGGAKDALPVVCTLSSSGLEQHQVIAVSDQEDARQLVSCGTVKKEEVVIVNPMTAVPCTESEVGEVWVSGPHIARGYWNNKEATERTFKATMPGCENGPYLRTGDLGFIKDGELFITGRIKDLIIIRGRNYYPQDIELAAWQSHGSLRPGRAAAFTIDSSEGEQLIVVQEIERNYRKTDLKVVVEAIREAVIRECGLRLHQVVLLLPNTIPTTTSGKIQRHACRRGFLDGQLSSILERSGGSVGLQEGMLA